MASISAIRSIGHRDATKLRKSKVRTTDSLLEQAATRTGRSVVSQRTGLATSDLLRWAHQADLMRIGGIGSEYADLLAAVGVDTIKLLRRRNADNLMAAMSQVNTRRRLVQRLPTVEMVQSWIDKAIALEPIVTS
jgi:predicted flap endonuclease-1-like 5' DNA nuclease